MKFLSGALILILLAACAPVKSPALNKVQTKQQGGQPELASSPTSATLPPPPAPPLPAPPRATRTETLGITFEGVAFDSRSAILEVADQAGGPGSQFPDSAAAGRALGGSAAINAGFFTPEGAPLGLVAANGKISGSWNSASSLGSGVWARAFTGASAISRRENLGKVDAGRMQELIQAGPLLVENGALVSGLETSKTSTRIAILWNGGTKWWIGRASPCTLAAFSQAIIDGKPAGWKVQQALNLDGGRSADLWISSEIPGGPVSRRTAWNRPVRNFLVLKTL